MNPETITKIGDSYNNGGIEYVKVYTSGSAQYLVFPKSEVPPNAVGKKVTFTETTKPGGPKTFAARIES